MPFIPVGADILEARIITFDPTSPVQLGVNVSHWVVQSNVGGTLTLDDAADKLDAVVAPRMKLLLSNTILYRGVMVSKIWPTPRTLPGKTIINAGVGTGGVDQLPTQVSGLIKVFTDTAGRAFRGRMYVPFPSPAASQANGNPGAVYVTNLTGLATALFQTQVYTVGASVLTLNPIIWHNKAFGRPPAGAKTFTFVTGAIGSPLFATQRRRGNFGRVNSSSPI